MSHAPGVRSSSNRFVTPLSAATSASRVPSASVASCAARIAALRACVRRIQRVSSSTAGARIGLDPRVGTNTSRPSAPATSRVATFRTAGGIAPRGLRACRLIHRRTRRRSYCPALRPITALSFGRSGDAVAYSRCCVDARGGGRYADWTASGRSLSFIEARSLLCRLAYRAGDHAGGDPCRTTPCQVVLFRCWGGVHAGCYRAVW
jgi:hypothetical protein